MLETSKYTAPQEDGYMGRAGAASYPGSRYAFLFRFGGLGILLPLVLRIPQAVTGRRLPRYDLDDALDKHSVHMEKDVDTVEEARELLRGFFLVEAA